MKYNDTIPVVESLVSEYGVPRWDVESSYSPKSGNLLLVPVQSETPDSLSLMAFIELDNKVWYKHFTASTSDTLVRDMMLYYRMQVYPKDDYPDRWVQVSTGSSKEIYEYCYDFYSVTKAGVKTYLYTYCWYEIFTSLSDNVIEDRGSPDGGGWTDLSSGNSGGNPDDTPPTTPRCPTEINPIELQTLNQVIANITFHGDCMTNTMIQAAKAYSTIAIDKCLKSDGTFFPESRRIYFNSLDGINEWAVHEELTHAYQDFFYPNGIAQYCSERPGNTNLEFEAKLLHTFLHFQTLEGNTWLQHVFNSPDVWNEMRMWWEDYMSDGLTLEFWTGYEKYLKIFNDKTVNSGYGGFLDPNFPKMTFIEHLRNKCKNTQTPR